MAGNDKGLPEGRFDLTGSPSSMFDRPLLRLLRR